MDMLLQGTTTMMMLVAICFMIVLMAIVIDFCAGIYKAHWYRHEKIRSEKMRHSVLKFIIYEGVVFISCFADIIIHFCKLWEHVGLSWLYGLPVFTFIVTLILCVIECKSVFEKADDDDKKKFADVVDNAKDIAGVLAQLANNGDKLQAVVELLNRQEQRTQAQPAKVRNRRTSSRKPSSNQKKG